MRKIILFCLMVITWVSLSVTAHAISMVSGLGGAAGYGENQLADNDDGSTRYLGLSSVMTGGLNFYGTTYTGLYLNNNGNVTFGSSLGTFTPYNLTGNTNLPIIAAFFADVDTRGAGDVYYDFDENNHIFSATWDQVGYFSNHTSPLNSFQIRLIDLGNENFTIEFRYELLGWMVGDVSGTHYARAGFNSGNGTDYFELTESGIVDEMLDLVNRSNVGVAGLFQWDVINGQVIIHDNTVPEPSTLLLMGSGLAGLVVWARKRKSA